MLNIFHLGRRPLSATLLILSIIWGGSISISNSLAADTKRPLQIVGFGDSLMAGYELPEADGFTSVLQAALKNQGVEALVTNAGVSGDTSSGGLERIDWSIPDGTDLVILELGANDALRGISPKITRTNLDQMITRLKQRNIEIVLAGMLAPPNLGKTYEADFNSIYPDLALQYELPLIPFFLDGVTTKPEFLLADQLHPNRKGIDIMVEGALKVMMPKIQTLTAQP